MKIVKYTIKPARVGTSLYLVKHFENGMQDFARGCVTGMPISFPKREEEIAHQRCKELNETIGYERAKK